MTETRLFTPRLTGTDLRLCLHVSPEDHAKIGRGPWVAVITDLETGVTYVAEGAPCSLGHQCWCDAVVTELP